MAQMVGLLWCPRQQGSSDDSRDSRGAAVAAVSRHRGTPPGCGGIGRRLVRKLRKQGKVLCSATRPAATTFRCQYDPLSYALNFDADGFGDDYAYHFAFSSRFASGAAAVASFKCPAAAGGLVVAAGGTHHHLVVSASL